MGGDNQICYTFGTMDARSDQTKPAAQTANMPPPMSQPAAGVKTAIIDQLKIIIVILGVR